MITEVLGMLTTAQLVQDVPPFRDPKGLFHVHKSPPLDPILSQMNPVQIITPHFFNICFNITVSPTPRCAKWFFLQDFSARILYTFVNLPMCGYCMSPCFISPDLILLVRLWTARIIWSSSFQICHFPQSWIQTVSSAPSICSSIRLWVSLPHTNGFSEHETEEFILWVGFRCSPTFCGIRLTDSHCSLLQDSFSKQSQRWQNDIKWHESNIFERKG
jgi:hypothetical protein